MKKKACVRCKISKNISEFHKNKTKKDGLQIYCKECSKANSQRLYKSLSKKEKKDRLRIADEKVVRNKQFVWDYLKEHPCVDCFELDAIVLEFDHITDSKEYNISNMTSGGYSIESIKQEIAKCEVRCANCHRRKTAEQFGWYKKIVK